MIAIRRIKPDEWPLLKKARLSALRDTPSAYASTWEQDNQLPDSVWRQRTAAERSCTILALDQGEPTGMAIGILDTADNALAYLVSMWVAPAFRGTGTAAALVEQVEKWAREQGAATLTLGVQMPNDRAMAFYRKCGFETYQGILLQHPAVSGCGAVLSKSITQFDRKEHV